MPGFDDSQLLITFDAAANRFFGELYEDTQYLKLSVTLATKVNVIRRNVLEDTRVVTQLDSCDTCIVRINKLRHAINRLQIESFARSRGQKIFVFPARHTRQKKAGGSRDLDIDNGWKYKTAPM
jgi:hypothetical protein